jgi:hypothetical protein
MAGGGTGRRLASPDKASALYDDDTVYSETLKLCKVQILALPNAVSRSGVKLDYQYQGRSLRYGRC